jgi:hypothetical protein
MTRFRIASRFVAVVAGAYAALMLIDCRLIDFGVAVAICAAASVAAGLTAYICRQRAVVWDVRDEQAVDATEQLRPSSDEMRQALSDSPRFVDRQAARHARLPKIQSRDDQAAAGRSASADE